MKKLSVFVVSVFLGCPAFADNVAEIDRLLCSAGQVLLCLENGECYPVMPRELNMPRFIIIDTDAGTISSTPASGQNRSTPIANMIREGGLILLQGAEHERAFSLAIDEQTGLLTAAVSSDGFSATVFGACTDADT